MDQALFSPSLDRALAYPPREYRLVARGFGLWSGAMHLGYGSKVGWARRALIACLMVIPSLFLGFSWLTAAFPVVFLGLYALSNWKPMAKSFTWVLVCSINGIVLGATLCAAAYNCWFCK